MPFYNRKCAKVLAMIMALCGSLALGAETKAKSKRTSAQTPPVSEEISFDLVAPSAKKSTNDTSKFEELQFEKSLVIEAKVERPQVQFPLLKEAPPEKVITFEASFREQLLDVPRENTFQLK